MTRSLIPFLAIIAGLVLKSAPAAAHGGGLDAYGCHNNRKTGDYHCHNSGRSSSRTSSYSTYSGYSTPKPVRVSRPSRARPKFSCLGPFFQDPNDTQYHYCKTVDGYGINHNGVMTGEARQGTRAYDAILQVDPNKAPTSGVGFTCTGPTFKGDDGNLYCRTAQGFGINRNGLPLGEAKSGSAEFDTIQAMESKHSAVSDFWGTAQSTVGPSILFLRVLRGVVLMMVVAAAYGLAVHLHKGGQR